MSETSQNQTMTLNGITIIPIETPSLGDRSYVAHDGRVALVVDPQRDLDRVEDLLAADGLELLVVAETHIHNDYVTGGHALATKTGATYLVNADDEVSFERTPVRDGETVEVGDRMRLSAVATPGHTFTHLSYVLSDASTGEQVAVFSGGSLLFGATGRPDLLGEEHTDELVRLQHHSARTPGAAASGRSPGPAHPRVRVVLRSDPVRCHVLDRRAGEGVEPRPDPGRGDLRPRAARRTRRLARLLRPHGAGQRRRAGRGRPVGPRRGGPRRAPLPHRGRGVGRGPAQPHRVRRRARARHLQLRARRRASPPTWAG